VRRATVCKAGAEPADRLMDTGEMVDAALAGLELGEIGDDPVLAELADWSRFGDTCLAMRPNLSLTHAARRYRRAGGIT